MLPIVVDRYMKGQSHARIVIKMCIRDSRECYMEPGLKDAKAFDSFQFVRNGYFCVDCKDSAPGAPV